MTTKILRYFFALGFFLVLTSRAQAETITFDDLSGSAVDVGKLDVISVPNGYAGLNWKDFYVFDTSIATSDAPTSGFLNGTISGHNVGMIPDFTVPALGKQYFPPAVISAPVPFYFLSAYVTAGWLNGITLEVEGKNGTTVAFDQTFILNTTNASLLTFPAVPLTEVDFTTSGGDYQHNPYLIENQEAGIDNLTIDFVNVPEAASSALLLAVSAGGLALLRKRLA